MQDLWNEVMLGMIIKFGGCLVPKCLPEILALLQTILDPKAFLGLQ